MSSTILYRFRSGQTFEALPLSGSAARLFDVKKAIVAAKKLDSGTMDFDLSVRNAATEEEYNDESMLLPRGTRLIVQRLPAAKGLGFLARMARNQYGMSGGQSSGAIAGSGAGGAPSGFYTLDSRVNDDDEEFFTTTGGINDEDKELAALKAVTDTVSTGGNMRTTTANFGRSAGPAGHGTAPQHHQNQHHGGGGQGQHRQPKQRQNADPELREQEKKLMGRKRATGIPRTFLNLSVTHADGNDGDGEGESNTPLLQPNTMGFEELKNRGGGQSENAAGTKKSLDYALKVTATSIPEYLQCALCHSVALTAMFLTWDPEGRTTCEKCIRDALTENGFRDPLTGMEGVSPDDLRPNPGIRKAAEAFVKEVMDKIEEIEKQQVEDEQTESIADTSKSGTLLEGDSGGIVLTKRNSITKRKSKEEDDPFGGEDDFGGDVFAVEKPKESNDVWRDGDMATKDAKLDILPASEVLTSPVKAEEPSMDSGWNRESDKKSPEAKENCPQVDKKHDRKDEQSPAPSRSQNTDRQQNDRGNRRDNIRQRRGPPAGYTMGPAGGAINPNPVPLGDPRDAAGLDEYSTSSQGGRGGGRDVGGHISPGRGGGRFQDYGSYRGRVGRGGRFGGRTQGLGDWDRNNYSSGRDNDYVSRSPPLDYYLNVGDNEGRSSKRPRNSGDDNGSRKQELDERSGGSDYVGPPHGAGRHGVYNGGGPSGYHNHNQGGGGYHHHAPAGGGGGHPHNNQSGWYGRGGGRGPPFRGAGGAGRGGWDRGGYDDGGRWVGGRGGRGGPRGTRGRSGGGGRY